MYIVVKGGHKCELLAGGAYSRNYTKYPQVEARIHVDSLKTDYAKQMHIKKSITTVVFLLYFWTRCVVCL